MTSDQHSLLIVIKLSALYNCSFYKRLHSVGIASDRQVGPDLTELTIKKSLLFNESYLPSKI